MAYVIANQTVVNSDSNVQLGGIMQQELVAPSAQVMRGREFMASPEQLIECRKLQDKEARSFCVCRESSCAGYLQCVRELALVPPWTAHLFILSAPAIVFGLIHECIGCMGIRCGGKRTQNCQFQR